MPLVVNYDKKCMNEKPNCKITLPKYICVLCVVVMQVTLVKMLNEATSNIPNWDTL